MDKELMAALAPNTDQLNADDLFGIDSIVVTIKGPVTVKGGRLNIPLEEMKPYRPSKGMGRIIMNLYGDRDNWPGKRLRLFRNPEVKFGGLAVGGIEISEVSHIKREMNFMVTVSRGKKKKHSVKPLVDIINPVQTVKIALRQAQNKEEIDAAVSMADRFTDDQKRLLTEDYNAAVSRAAKTAE